MADPEHLAVLGEGKEAWNGWRRTKRAVVDLSDADLTRAKLDGFNLQSANLSGIILRGSSVRDADVSHADLTGADLRDADFAHSNLEQSCLSRARVKMTHFHGTDLRRADLRGLDFAGNEIHASNLSAVNLSEAILNNTDLSSSSLYGTNLSQASLVEANLLYATLSNIDTKGADFTRATFAHTTFEAADLSEALGLEHAKHTSPSTIDFETIRLSKGRIPSVFLRGCGLSDADVEYAKLAGPGLSNGEISDITYRIYHLKATQAVQISPLFISYNHDDGPFVDAMEGHLNEEGVRFWRDAHHATAGKLDKIVDRAMRLNPTVLLVLSEHSVNSDWVEHEATKARELEKELKRDVLCPVALDDSWKDCDWSEVLRRQIMKYHILSFSKWKDDDFFARQFNKLIEGLQIFYKDEKPNK